MVNWTEKFTDDDIFFVTPDIKRGLGFAAVLPKYHVICTDFDPLIPVLRRQGAKIFCLEEEGTVDTGGIRNSGKLLAIPQVLGYIKNNSKNIPRIMYFKPSLKLDSLIKQYGFIPIGNNAELNEFFEDKISLYNFAQINFTKHAVPAVAGVLGNLNFSELNKQFGLPLVVQFGHGWAGKTTFMVNEEKEFLTLTAKFPHTRIKVGKFISGFTVLNNCCIYGGKILVSSPAIQIDGIAELGGKPGATCGRQWPAKFIDGDQTKVIKTISQAVGALMGKSGFKGFFGIDFLVEEKTGKVYLSEVNARMTASSAFFTCIEIGAGVVPFLAYHLAAFTKKSLPARIEDDIKLTASQIIIRKSFKPVAGDKLFGVFSYENQKAIFIKEEYYPQNLKEDEFIFMGRKTEGRNTDNEFARIETTSEVLDKPKRLKNWITDWLIGI